MRPHLCNSQSRVPCSPEPCAVLLGEEQKAPSRASQCFRGVAFGRPWRPASASKLPPHRPARPASRRTPRTPRARAFAGSRASKASAAARPGRKGRRRETAGRPCGVSAPRSPFAGSCLREDPLAKSWVPLITLDSRESQSFIKRLRREAPGALGGAAEPNLQAEGDTPHPPALGPFFLLSLSLSLSLHPNLRHLSPLLEEESWAPRLDKTSGWSSFCSGRPGACSVLADAWGLRQTRADFSGLFGFGSQALPSAPRPGTLPNLLSRSEGLPCARALV